MHNSPLILAISILLLAVRSAPAEVPIPSESDVFASGKSRFLTCYVTEDSISVSVTVRPTGGNTSYYYGEVSTKKAVGVFNTDAYTTEGTKIEIPITVRLAKGEIMLIADYPDALPTNADPSGTYKLLSADEHLTLVKNGYAEADKVLNDRWAALKTSLPKEKMADLTKRQREWIEHKEYMSEWNAGETPLQSPKYWESAWELTQTRLGFLDAFEGQGVPEGIAGVYIDGYGGMAQFEDLGGGAFKFEISVVRGPTFHVGQIVRTVKISEGSGKFVDDDEEAVFDGKRCTIDFSFDGGKLEIKGEHTNYYHGARAYFDGTYFKTRDSPNVQEEEEEG